MQAKTISIPRPSRAAYQAKRRLQHHDLYFRSPEELALFQQMAAAQGYGSRMFNAWLLQKVAEATSGSLYSPEYVSGLEKELERVRGWLDSARDENAAQRAELRTLQQQRDALLALVTELDPEQAARFLQSVTQGVRA